MSKIKELFGSMVFNDSVMKERLPHEDYKALRLSLIHISEPTRH